LSTRYDFSEAEELFAKEDRFLAELPLSFD
jgi:hypothetical protein